MGHNPAGAVVTPGTIDKLVVDLDDIDTGVAATGLLLEDNWCAAITAEVFLLRADLLNIVHLKLSNNIINI